MAYFDSDADVYGKVGRMFEEAVADPEIGPALAASGVVLRIEMSEPASVVTADLPNRVVDMGPDSVLVPTMTIKGNADVVHRYWLGEVNVGVAIAKGQIRVRGSVPTLINLASAAKPLFPRYRALVAHDG